MADKLKKEKEAKKEKPPIEQATIDEKPKPLTETIYLKQAAAPKELAEEGQSSPSADPLSTARYLLPQATGPKNEWKRPQVPPNWIQKLEQKRTAFLKSIWSLELREIAAKLLYEKSADGEPRSLSGEDINKVLDLAQKSLSRDQTLVKVSAPVVVVGDIHGQYYDLISLFLQFGWPGKTSYLFLGDYIDRGKQGIETATLLFVLKATFAKSFVLLRGNHECEAINAKYGFRDECVDRYDLSIYARFNEVFEYMPIAGIINGRVLCMHGGISKELTSLKQINKLVRPIKDVDSGIVADLLWADPRNKLKGYTASTRGLGSFFGEDALIDFLQQHELDFIIRGHEVFINGHEFFGGSKCLTVFSAPHYSDQFDNNAAVAKIDGDLKCEIKILK